MERTILGELGNTPRKDFGNGDVTKNTTMSTPKSKIASILQYKESFEEEAMVTPRSRSKLFESHSSMKEVLSYTPVELSKKRSSRRRSNSASLAVDISSYQLSQLEKDLKDKENIAEEYRSLRGAYDQIAIDKENLLNNMDNLKKKINKLEVEVADRNSKVADMEERYCEERAHRQATSEQLKRVESELTEQLKKERMIRQQAEIELQRLQELVANKKWEQQSKEDDLKTTNDNLKSSIKLIEIQKKKLLEAESYRHRRSLGFHEQETLRIEMETLLKSEKEEWASLEDTYQDQLQKLGEDLTLESKKAFEASQRADNFEREMERMKETIEGLVKDVEHQKQVDDENRKMISQLEKKLSAAKTCKKSLEKSLSEEYKRYNQLQTKHEKAKEQVEELSARINELERSKKLANDELEDFKIKFENLYREKEEKEKIVASLQEQVFASKGEYKALSEKFKAYQNDMEAKLKYERTLRHKGDQE